MMFEIVKANFYIVIKEHVIKHFFPFAIWGYLKKWNANQRKQFVFDPGPFKTKKKHFFGDT
jgi:hypothetical protein